MPLSKSPMGLGYVLGLIITLQLINSRTLFAGVYPDQILFKQITITGAVEDAKGNPIAHVTVVEAGTVNRTQTNQYGQFSLKTNNNTVTLQFSAVGFKNKLIQVNAGHKVLVTLEEESSIIDEVVVTAYGSANKRNFTGSLQEIKADNLTKTSAASFETSLQGNVTGLLVYTTGQPGGKSSVQIRGMGSINGIREPLYVLDGVVMNSDNNSKIGGNGAVNQINPLTSINSNDIESITVLKDAAAASLYGSRAANGVILITTKKGRKGETILSVLSQGGILSNLTKEKTISNQDFKQLWQVGQVNQYIQNNEGSDYTRIYNDSQLLQHYQSLAQKDYSSVYGHDDANSNWLDAIYRTGTTQQYSIAASGGNESTLFYASGEYLKQNGTIIKSDLERKSGRLNMENRAKSWLNLGANLSVAQSDRNSGQYDSEYVGGLNPLFMARVLPQAASIYDKNGYQGIADLPNLIEKNANPIGVIEVGKYENKDLRLRGSAFAELVLPYSIKFKSTLGIDHQSLEETLYDNKVFGAGGGQWNGALYVAQGQRSQLMTSNILSYQNRINKHSFDILAGFEAEESKMKSINNSGYDILDNELLSSSSIGTLWSWNGQSDNYALISYFSRLNYNLSNKYFISGSIRSDGSSRFGKDSRWGNFWSVSGAWLISDENFINHNKINLLKLRGSMGTNGNLPPASYASLGFFTTAGKAYASESGLSYGQLANPNLSWELSKNIDLGLDARLFNILDITLDYFNKKTSNLLLNIPVSSTTGFTSQLQNYGEMKNWGWEFSMKYRVIDHKDLKWDTRINGTILHNEITKLPSDLIPTYSSSNGQNPLITKVGESLNSFYLRDYAGVNHENGLASYHVLNDGRRTGELTTNAEEAGFGIFGNAVQKVQGGFLNQFNFKKFSLDVLLNYGIGGKAYDWTAFKRDDDGFLPQFTSTKAQLNPWTPLNPDSKVPIRINGNNTFSNDVSTRHLYNADYLKVRNIRLSYHLDKFRFLQGATCFIQGDNLLLWTRLDDFDPEAITNGVNLFQTPTSRSVLIGVQFKL
ncbi:SusC/RagA family TonB-linked outer membrane protein [Sphingobacterium sp. JUb56]|uniref:SusC/RagA family TonB-linked outer membrane protein n=1 Tax=Sphingobacterium sp. JUb56 TaxID=2587145 RepID=UPI00160C92C4|nr:SusC/RagA family TonB-linked outer membrane protein [Sphingobacterium sp. JUb56]MBB2950339.1 TonB-linked SusC/RagA family outer membrane protein [Sphingobacterium sp. JUb56]